VAVIGELTEIRILLTGQITVGQTLLIDYQYTGSGSIRFSALDWHYNLGLDFEWISLGYAHETISQDIISGFNEAFLLGDVSSDTFSARVGWDKGKLGSSATAEYKLYDSIRLSFKSLHFDQLLLYRFSPDASINMSFGESFFDFKIPERKTQTFFGRMNFIWRPFSSLIADGFSEFRVFRDTLAPDEKSFEVGLRPRWTFGKMEINSHIEYDIREVGDMRLKGISFGLRMIRRF